MRLYYNQKGFTLIEIILTITMLGILTIGLLSLFLYGYKYITMAGEKSKTVFENQEDTEDLIAQQGSSGSNLTIAITFPGASAVNVSGVQTTEGSLINFLPGLTSTTISVSSISVSPTTLTIPYIGGTDSISATILPTDATNQNIIWHTSDPSVVTVVGGVVQATGPGTATIMAETEDGNKTDTTMVTVNNAVMSSDASLSALTGAVINPGFNPNVLTYTSSGSGPPPNISGVATDAGATMIITQAQNRNNKNVATIVVTAQDGSTQRTYTVTFD